MWVAPLGFVHVDSFNFCWALFVHLATLSCLSVIYLIIGAHSRPWTPHEKAAQQFSGNVCGECNSEIGMKSSICWCQRSAPQTHHMPCKVAPFSNSFLVSRSILPFSSSGSWMATTKWQFTLWNGHIPPAAGLQGRNPHSDADGGGL